MPIDYGLNNITSSGNINVSGIVTATSGVFSNLTIGGSTFNSSVSGLLPTITNSGDNRILTSTGSTVGINAESNLTFDGNLLNITGSGAFSSNLTLSNQTASTIASFDSSKNITSLSTVTYPSLTELSYMKGVTSALQTQLNAKQNSLTNPVTGTGIASHIAYWNSSSGIVADSGQLYWDATNDRLGIGTSSPASSLEVSGNIQQTWLATDFRNGTFFNNDWRMGINYGTAQRTINIFSTSNDTGGHIAFSTRFGSGVSSTDYGTERLRITNSGLVGINTSTPTSRLHVIGSGIFSSGVTVGDSSTNGYIYGPSGNASIQFNAAGTNRIDVNSTNFYLSAATFLNGAATYVNGTLAFPKVTIATSTATQSNGNEILLYHSLWNGSSAYDGYNTLRSTASTTTNGVSRFAILMNNGDGTQNRTERLSVLSSGNIGINNTTPAYTLDVTGSGNFTGAVTVSGDITASMLASSNSAGSEGGEIRLAKAASGTTLNGTTINIDIFNNQLRIFEGGSPNRGYFLDMTEGGASGGTQLRQKSLTYFTALNNQPPASNFATLDTRNSIAVLDFDDTTEESAVFVGVIPDNAVTSSGLSVRINWMATTATSGNCRWGVQFERMNTDEDADSFDTATEAHSATNGTAGIPTTTTLTCTTIDSLAAGDFFRMKIYRDVSDTTNDTMTGDAELIAVEIRGVI